MKTLHLVTVVVFIHRLPGALLMPDTQTFQVPVWADDADEAKALAEDFYSKNVNDVRYVAKAADVRVALGTPLGDSVAG